MEINNLLSHLKKQDKPTKKYLVLHIAGEFVISACWEFLNNKAHIISTSSAIVTNLEDPENVLNSVDQSYSEACSTVDQEPNEVILSLPESWVQGDALIEEQKDLITHVTDKLELKSLGFVVAIEAIVHHLYTVKGQPVSALFIQKTVDELSVTWVEQGEIKDTHVVGTSEDIASDLQEAVARFTTSKNPPALLYLYNMGDDIEEVQQTLISIDWTGKIPFLHIPKIELLKFPDVLQAIVESSAFELTSQPVKAETPIREENETSPEEFGFQVTSTTDSEELSNLEEVDSNVVAVDEDVELSSSDDVGTNAPQKPSPLSTFLSKFKRPANPKKKLRKSQVPVLLIVGIVIMLLAATGAVATYWYYPQAKVTVYLEPLTIDRSISFTIVKGLDSVNVAAKQIPGTVMTSSVDFNGEVPVTGTKTVGEKATGTVTLYNRTNSSKTFEAGTELTGPDSLKYTLLESVSIASASSKENPDLSVTTEPATAQVKVTASEIGGKYNVGSGTEFSVANFDKSSYLARAEGEISGGSSKEITVVTAQDVRTLRNLALAELNEKVNQQFNQSSEDFDSSVVLPGQEDSIVENFSAEVGDEAVELSLEARMDVEVMSYRKSDVMQLLQEDIQATLTDNQQLLPEATEIQNEVISSSEDEVEVRAKVKASLSRVHNPEEIIANIKGKAPAVTESYFRSLQGFKRVEIDIRPKLPPQIKTLPRVANRIQVEFTTSPGE